MLFAGAACKNASQPRQSAIRDKHDSFQRDKIKEIIDKVAYK